MKVLTHKNIKVTFLQSFAYKVVCIDDRFTKRIVVYRDENATDEFIKAILKEYKYCRKIMNNHFKSEKKVRDHCHITGKFRGAVHLNCDINFQLTKKVPVIFHNLRSYDSHLIFCELDKCDGKIRVIPNGLEKYISFFLK